MNLAQHLNRFAQDSKQPDWNRYPVSLVIEWLDEAERVVNKESVTIHGSSIIDSISDQRLYDNIPSDLINWEIREIYYSVRTSTERRRLTPATIQELDAWKRNWREDTGAPSYWYLDKEQGKFGLFPYEKSVNTGTNCIEILYRKKHTKMTRYYVDGTASVTNGLTAVTGTATAWIGNSIANDELGFGKLLDRTTAFPTVFYSILTTPTANDALTLSSAFQEATQVTKNYIISSPSLITNDELNLCSILWAMGLAMKKDGEHSLKDTFQNEALMRVHAEVARLKADASSKKAMIPEGALSFPGAGISDYS